MPLLEMTYDIAMAASRDAGNRSMRKAGRTRWSVEDWNVAADEFNRLWPVERHLASLTATERRAVWRSGDCAGRRSLPRGTVSRLRLGDCRSRWLYRVSD